MTKTGRQIIEWTYRHREVPWGTGVSLFDQALAVMVADSYPNYLEKQGLVSSPDEEEFYSYVQKYWDYEPECECKNAS